MVVLLFVERPVVATGVPGTEPAPHSRHPDKWGGVRCADLADSSSMVTVDDVRRVVLHLPRTTEHLIRDRVKFRVKQLVYVAFSADETVMGFAFPKDQRAALVESQPDKFMLPSAADMRYHWVDVRTAELDVQEMTELVTDAWTMVVPKRVALEYFDTLPD
jgi:hypothetical protein